jgi:hypothetical protein
MGRSASVGLTWVAPVCQVYPAARTVESGAPAVFRQARLAEAWADSNRVAAVYLVGPMVDPGGLACFRRALSVGQAVADSAGSVSPVCPVGRDQASVFPDLDCRVFRACWAHRVLVCRVLVCRVSGCRALVCQVPVSQVSGSQALASPEPDGGRREDSPDVQIEVPDNLVADSLADDSAVDDSPSYHRILGGWPTRSVADDTNNVADDKGFPSRSNSRGCSRPASLPNSIPNHPIPRGDCPQSGRQSRCPR